LTSIEAIAEMLCIGNIIFVIVEATRILKMRPSTSILFEVVNHDTIVVIIFNKWVSNNLAIRVVATNCTRLHQTF